MSNSREGIPDEGKHRFLLRIEGVNLANVIDDTDQLSIRRGGGLMMLNAVASLRQILPADVYSQIEEIATGASIGLFEFEATVDGAEVLRRQVDKALKTGSLTYRELDRNGALAPVDSQLPLKHGTFVVDVQRVPASADATQQQQAEQLVTARNRWRQLQTPSLSLDQMFEKGENSPCEFDKTRVATEKHWFPGDGGGSEARFVSKSAKDRWHYGRGARQKFYRDELQAYAIDPEFGQFLDRLAFTNDLKQLSGWPLGEDGQSLKSFEGRDGRTHVVPDHLIDKIAVFYVDGNGFGEEGRKIFKSNGKVGYRAWSNALRGHHRGLLKGLLALTQHDPTWLVAGPDGRLDSAVIRLETLTWGGDEILWIVPSWKGWEVVNWFFRQGHEISLDCNSEKHELTYACGLVFCNAKTPLSNVKRLAYDLGSIAKSARPKSEHSLAYEVLESYPDVSGDLVRHRERFIPAGMSTDQLVLNPCGLNSCWKVLLAIAASARFPMRQLFSLVANWRGGKKAEELQSQMLRLERGCVESGVGMKELEDVKKVLQDPVCWHHLLQMLPYLPFDCSGSVSEEAV